MVCLKLLSQVTEANLQLRPDILITGSPHHKAKSHLHLLQLMGRARHQCLLNPAMVLIRLLGTGNSKRMVVQVLPASRHMGSNRRLIPILMVAVGILHSRRLRILVTVQDKGRFMINLLLPLLLLRHPLLLLERPKLLRVDMFW